MHFVLLFVQKIEEDEAKNVITQPYTDQHQCNMEA